MMCLGLTGSIGMGKSATAEMFRQAGIPVYDADAAVHAIYAAGGSAVEPLSARFGDIVTQGAIDRVALRARVLDDPQAMADLEAIVHPLVAQTQLDFRREASESKAFLAVLDIPLLYETGGESRVDAVAVVSAPLEIQRERVLARPSMTERDFEKILARQLPDAEKRARADFVLSTAWGYAFTKAHVSAIIDLFRQLETGPT
jgi:dephospho-CoA kinase